MIIINDQSSATVQNTWEQQIASLIISGIPDSDGCGLQSGGRDVCLHFFSGFRFQSGGRWSFLEFFQMHLRMFPFRIKAELLLPSSDAVRNTRHNIANRATDGKKLKNKSHSSQFHFSQYLVLPVDDEHTEDDQIYWVSDWWSPNMEPKESARWFFIIRASQF